MHVAAVAAASASGAVESITFAAAPKVALAAPTITGTQKVGATLQASVKTMTKGAALGYQWYASGSKISGATKSRLLLTSSQAGKAVTVKVTAKKTGYTSATTASAATSKIVKSAIPTVSGTAKVGATLTAKPGTWTSGVKLAYTWTANGAAISGATKSTFVVKSAQTAKTIRVNVASAQAGFAKVTEKSTTSVKPARTSVPTISGTAKVGSTLTAAPGLWTTGTTLKYQWYAGKDAIAGATKSTLVLATKQAGQAITVKVTGSLTGFTTFTETSKTTSAVAALKPVASTVPTISGEVALGSTLTAEPGTWATGATLAYQWFADNVAISGATTSTLVIAKEHGGTALTVTVTGSQTGYATVAQTSKATVKVVSSATPTITGQTKVGATLSVTPGAWTSGVSTFDYTWFANGTPIEDATSSTLTLTGAQLSKTIAVRLESAQDGYAQVSANATLTVKTAQTSVPTITGRVKVGETLTATPGEWTTGTKLSYQWYAGNAGIAGARNETLVIAPKYAGMVLTVKVTGSRTGYTTFTETSQATGNVEATAAPTISGDTRIGGTLSVDPGTWAEGITTFTYQWYSDDVAIDGATSRTVTLASEQAEATISVRVTSAQDGFESETVTATHSVKALRTELPTIVGDSGANRGMYVPVPVWTPGTTFTYEWFADGVQIEGETDRFITLGDDMNDKSVTAQVTGTLAGYGTATLESAVAMKHMTTVDPIVEGEPKVGSTLTVTPGVWTTGAVFSYQWFAGYDMIEGATDSSLLLTADLVGKNVVVRVTGVIDGYTETYLWAGNLIVTE
ncbi:hypothetical protein GCM10022381_14390 [Leifsonia kafniensis]|uniref:Ig-like domain-containing protein n=2 Tax=Leifsonia kafniensis TaxID=475957 RepID=A0ABP7KBS9_9MICO